MLQDDLNFRLGAQDLHDEGSVPTQEFFSLQNQASGAVRIAKTLQALKKKLVLMPAKTGTLKIISFEWISA